MELEGGEGCWRFSLMLMLVFAVASSLSCAAALSPLIPAASGCFKYYL